MTTHLTDSQKQTIRCALAKWMGITEYAECPVCHLYKGQGHASFCDQIPNYPDSLDDCHEIEVKLTDEEHGRFRVILCGMIGTEGNADDEKNYVSASAEHRSLALFRALNLGELGD